MKRKSAALLCALSLCAGLALPASAAEFRDVDPNSWYGPAVREVVDQGLMAGTGEGLFSPDTKVTRSTVAVVLWRMEGEPAPGWRGCPVRSWR